MPKISEPPSPLDTDPGKKPTASDAAIEEAAKRLSRRQIIKDASEYVKKHILSLIHISEPTRPTT